MSADNFNNLFVNQQQNSQPDKELVIRASEGVDLSALATELDGIRGIETELRTPETSAPEPDQQAQTADGAADKGFLERFADRMSTGSRTSPGAVAAREQLEQNARDPPDGGDPHAYQDPDVDRDAVGAEVDDVVDAMTWGEDG